MAGSKTVPLTWGIGGPIIGTATIDENGLVMGDIENDEFRAKAFGLATYLSIDPPKPITDPDEVEVVSIGGD